MPASNPDTPHRAPTVSVIIATLAQPGWDAYVPDLFHQTHPPIEVIVVVDRATEASERAAMTAAQPCVTFVFNDRNLGPFPSANAGLAIARGDIIVRVDDDDESLPNRIEKQLEAFGRHHADFVCSFAEGFVIGMDSKRWLIDCPTDPAALVQALLKRNLVVHSTVAFRRDAVLAIGGYDEIFRYAGDYAFYLKVIRAGFTVAVVPEVLVRRSYSSDTITVKKRKQQIMYSAVARLLHSAAINDPWDFARTIADRFPLLLVPNAARQWRRRVFRLIGRGA